MDQAVATQVLGQVVDPTKKCRRCGAVDFAPAYSTDPATALGLATLVPGGLTLTFAAGAWTAQFGAAPAVTGQDLAATVAQAALNIVPALISAVTPTVNLGVL